MRGGKGCACLLAIALLSALSPSLPARPSPGPAPVGPVFVDAPAWFLNDTWTYTTHALTRAPNGMRTDTTLVLTTRIVEVTTQTVRSTSYTTYNATTNGNVTTDGEIPLGGLGTRPFHLQGTSSGWVWTDRSDLAVIVTNQTGNATGWVDLGFPFGRQRLDADGATTILFLPALEDYDFPLELADAWSHTVTANTTGYIHFRAQTPVGPQENTTSLAGETSASTSLWLNTTEDIIVSGMRFANATHIHTAANGGGSGDRWYHPDAKNVVRSESHAVAAVNDYSHVWVNLTAMSLVAPPWPGTIALTPQRVDPGGWITASGTASPNEDLVVSVPVLPATFSTRASAGGAWSIRLRAPTMDDFTPANADVGSHGVLVEPGATPSGWAIATVQLVLPDLSVGGRDFPPVQRHVPD